MALGNLDHYTGKAIADFDPDTSPVNDAVYELTANNKHKLSVRITLVPYSRELRENEYFDIPLAYLC